MTPEPVQIAPLAAAQPQPPPAPRPGRRPSTPLVRRRAIEDGLDLADVVAPGARITLADVAATAAARATSAARPIRAVAEVDVTGVAAEAGDQPDRFLAMVALAIARALRRPAAGAGWALRLPGPSGRRGFTLGSDDELSLDRTVALMRGATPPAAVAAARVVGLVDARSTGLIQAEVWPVEPDVATISVGRPRRRLRPLTDRLGGEAIAIRTVATFSIVSVGGFAGIEAVGAFWADVSHELTHDPDRLR